MQRNPTELTQEEFDLLVVGGGAFGAAAAREAALRGLRTALIERADYGGGASAECFKMVHGGIRYLQHGHLARVRASCAERSALLRIAPHLVQPLPIVVPTYGRGRRGKFLLGAGLRVYDWLTHDRNSGIDDPARQIADGCFLGRGEVTGLFPELDTAGLTGAAVFEDGQMYHPARLVLAFVKAAAASGAAVCNYVAAEDFLRTGGAIQGVRAHDRLSGERFDIRARLVLNAAGPRAERLLSGSRAIGALRRGVYSRDAYVVLRRPPASDYALALPGRAHDSDALISRSARHLFLVPWRRFTLMGVWHRVFGEAPDKARIDADEMRAWMDELNSVCPALELREEEIAFAHCGLVPFGQPDNSDNKALAGERLSFGKHSRLIDHRHTDGVRGLVTVIGIRFTNARGDAARALDLLLEQHPSPPAAAASERLPLPGGSIESFAHFRAQAQRARDRSVPTRSLEALLRNHGSDYEQVLAAEDSQGERLIDGSDTLVAEVVHAVRQESAVRLEDVVLRRTDLGNAQHPGHAALEHAAARMAALLHWPTQRRAEEIAACEQVLKQHAALAPGAASAVQSAS